MVLKGDDGPTMEGDDMFSLKQLSTAKQITAVIDQAPDVVAESDNEEETPKPKYQRYEKDGSRLASSGLYYKDSDSELEMESDEEDEVKEGLGLGDDSDQSDGENKKKPTKTKKKDKNSEHPLITDLDYRDKEQKRAHKAELWFERDVFKNLIDEKDEDADLDKMVEEYKKKGAKLIAETKDEKTATDKTDKDSDYSSDGTTSDSDVEDYDIEEEQAKLKKSNKKNGFEIVKDSQSKKTKRKLTEEELALGTLIATSKKMKRDLIDGAWNRYAFNDDHLPDWFVQDELKHMRKEAPVPKVNFTGFCLLND